jgi:hypothetical protein
MLYESTSGMKRKAPGAQYRAKRQTAVGWPRRGEQPKAASQPEPIGIGEDFEHRVTQRFGRVAIRTAFR